MNYPHIFSIPAICSQLGIKNVIICPGSRSAPLTIAFTRHKDFDCKVIPDERSAAFIAMGIAQQLKEPVILICTSGSASLNFLPAIAEAYYQQIPLIILTADRPAEWIDQLDGQTIRQEKVYGNHVKASFNIQTDKEHADAQWHSQRMMSEAIAISTDAPQGPVHLNFPFREPLYPDHNEFKDVSTKVITNIKPKLNLDNGQFDSLIKQWNSFKRKLIVCGQGILNTQELEYLHQLSDKFKIPVVGDIISNIHELEYGITHPDVFLGSSKSGLHESLQPDLLITFGKSVLSKHLKIMLRKYKPQQHWHIQSHSVAADTYQSLTHVIQVSQEDFLKRIAEQEDSQTFDTQKQENYYHIWQIEERKTRRVLSSFLPTDNFGEFEVVKKVLEALPENTNLHLANSMSVRYANFIGIGSDKKNIKVFSNRGTSGIDGCNSTAVGAALSSSVNNVLITGDMAFFYDRNAFWHNYQVPNLKILVLNNHGGTIFKMIKGPNQQPELEEYFVTEQKLKAEQLAKEYGFDYLFCDKRSKLNNYIKQFMEDDDVTKILEIETNADENQAILEQFRADFNTQ
ncbi:2-succinyl-5-enolpyruvyl-6-hydroxy-3-cyclohexene-1-carboxylic-acid synthase, partial [Fulvivirga lutimaris]|uniref:2-succinyl-5-enolpyruvyl-6-hydroxy-3- cyclohexene-1-carboxylic-acid synthase n=1 Tax=Fulvivirga lutimaris TaxID=1819566 RepID=UPI0012BC0FEB